jgi:hypothetical protein
MSLSAECLRRLKAADITGRIRRNAIDANQADGMPLRQRFTNIQKM